MKQMCFGTYFSVVLLMFHLVNVREVFVQVTENEMGNVSSLNLIENLFPVE